MQPQRNLHKLTYQQLDFNAKFGLYADFFNEIRNLNTIVLLIKTEILNLINTYKKTLIGYIHKPVVHLAFKNICMQEKFSFFTSILKDETEFFKIPFRDLG